MQIVDSPSRRAFKIEDFPAPVAPHNAIKVVGVPWFWRLESENMATVRRCTNKSETIKPILFKFAEPNVLAHLGSLIYRFNALFDRVDLSFVR